MSRKRVVVTGLSALTPLGGNVTESWDNLLAGKSGIGPITLFDASGFDSRIAGEVKGFDPEAYGIPAKQARRMDRFVQFAVAAGNMLVEHSGLVINDDNAGRVSVILGVGLGGLHTIEVFHSRLVEAGPGKVSPFMIPMLISNMAPGQLAIATGAKGANMVLTSACASGTHAIGAAYTEIVMGRCDACISGGVEATVTPMGISGFTALKALSTAHNDDPEKASRPFDKDRDGFVMGEGAGLLMLESLEHAQARGATIYAEIIGAGSSDDAFHMTAPRGLTAASGIDVMTHAIESYVSIMASDYTKGLSERAAKLVFENLPSSFTNGAKDPHAREEMHNASCMAGMAFANAFLGLNHSMAHKLGAFHHLPHGLANAVILTRVMRYNAAEAPVKMGTFSQYPYPNALHNYAEMAKYCGIEGKDDKEVFENFITKLEELKDFIGVKKTIADYGVDEQYFLDTLDEMTEQAFNDQCTGANPRYPLMSEIKELYLDAYYGREPQDYAVC